MKYIAPIVIIVLALLAANGIYVVGQGHAAVVSRLGNVESAGIGPGLHFKLPFVQEVTIFDARQIVTQVDPDSCKTRAGQAMRVGFNVRWKVADAAAYFKATAGNELQATQQMMPLIRAALCKEVAADDLPALLEATGAGAGAKAREAVADEIRGKLGIAVLGVGIARVLPPESGLDAVYKRMDDEAKAQSDAVRADGAAAAAVIRAKGDAEDEQVLAAANEAAATVRGQGDAAAAKIYAAASARDPQFFRYWSTLDTWRRSFSGGGAVVVLDKDSPFMQAVDAGAAGGGSPAKKH